MTPERIAELRLMYHSPSTNKTKVIHECLDEIERLQKERDESSQFTRFLVRQYVPPEIAEAIRDNNPWLKETT